MGAHSSAVVHNQHRHVLPCTHLFLHGHTLAPHQLAGRRNLGWHTARWGRFSCRTGASVRSNRGSWRSRQIKIDVQTCLVIHGIIHRTRQQCRQIGPLQRTLDAGMTHRDFHGRINPHHRLSRQPFALRSGPFNRLGVFSIDHDHIHRQLSRICNQFQHRVAALRQLDDPIEQTHIKSGKPFCQNLQQLTRLRSGLRRICHMNSHAHFYCSDRKKQCKTDIV